MTPPGSTIPAFVVLPSNFPVDATSQLVAGASTTDTDKLPIHASDLVTAQWEDILYVVRCDESD